MKIRAVRTDSNTSIDSINSLGTNEIDTNVMGTNDAGKKPKRLQRSISNILLISLVCAILPAKAQQPAALSTANAYLSQQKYPEAIETLQSVIEQNPNLPNLGRVKNSIGWAYYLEDKVPEAKENLQSARRLAIANQDEKSLVIANNNLGVISFVEEDYESAKQYFSEPVNVSSKTAKEYLPKVEAKINESIAENLTAKGVQFAKQDKFAEALAQYDKALQITPDDARVLEYKGYANFKLQRYQQSIAATKASLAADPKRAWAKINLLKAYCATADGAAIVEAISAGWLRKQEIGESLLADSELRKTCKEHCAHCKAVDRQ